MMARSREDLRNVGGAFGRVPMLNDKGEVSRYWSALVEQRRNIGRTVERRNGIERAKQTNPDDRHVYAYGMKVLNVD